MTPSFPISWDASLLPGVRSGHFWPSQSLLEFFLTPGRGSPCSEESFHVLFQVLVATKPFICLSSRLEGSVIPHSHSLSFLAEVHSGRGVGGEVALQPLSHRS